MPPLKNSQLRYLEAAQVEHPSGTLEGFQVCTDSQRSLGSIEGVLVEPSQRRVRYFVVGPRGWARRRYLISASCPARLDTEHGRIYVEGDHPAMRPYTPQSVPRFSDDDLIDTMFPPQVA